MCNTPPPHVGSSSLDLPWAHDYSPSTRLSGLRGRDWWLSHSSAMPRSAHPPAYCAASLMAGRHLRYMVKTEIIHYSAHHRDHQMCAFCVSSPPSCIFSSQACSAVWKTSLSTQLLHLKAWKSNIHFSFFTHIQRITQVLCLWLGNISQIHPLPYSRCRWLVCFCYVSPPD